MHGAPLPAQGPVPPRNDCVHLWRPRAALLVLGYSRISIHGVQEVRTQATRRWPLQLPCIQSLRRTWRKHQAGLSCGAAARRRPNHSCGICEHGEEHARRRRKGDLGPALFLDEHAVMFLFLFRQRTSDRLIVLATCTSSRPGVLREASNGWYARHISRLHYILISRWSSSTR